LVLFITLAIFLTPYKIVYSYKGIVDIESRGFLPIFSLPNPSSVISSTHIDLTILLILSLVITVIWISSYFIIRNNSDEI